MGLYYTVDDGATPFGAHINLDELFAASTPTGQVLVFDPTPLTADTTKAVFVDGSWSMLEALRLVFGVRLSKERRELTQTFHPYVEDRATGLPVSSTVTQTLLDTGLLLETCDKEHHARDYASTDPKLGVEWDVLPDTMVYAQYQTAFKAGGFNSSNRCNQSYEPERIKSYELGLKTSLMDGGVVLNSAVFSYDYTDYQVEKVEGFGSVIENAAAATVQGLEIETVVTPTSWLNLDFKYSFLDATYAEYIWREHHEGRDAADGEGRAGGGDGAAAVVHVSAPAAAAAVRTVRPASAAGLPGRAAAAPKPLARLRAGRPAPAARPAPRLR